MEEFDRSGSCTESAVELDLPGGQSELDLAAASITSALALVR